MPLYQLHQFSSSSISAQFKSLLFCFLIFGIQVPCSLWWLIFHGWELLTLWLLHHFSHCGIPVSLPRGLQPVICIFVFVFSLSESRRARKGRRPEHCLMARHDFSLFVSWAEHWFSVVVSFLQCL